MGFVRLGSALAAVACLWAGCGAPSVPDPGGGWVHFTAVPATAGDGAKGRDSGGRLEVRGSMLGGLEPSALTVRRVAPPGFDAPALVGDTRREGEKLVFEPRFPFDRGLTYLARLLSDGPVREFEFSFPVIEVLPSTELVLVTPSADRLPANLLKFYLHFSAPMSRGEAYERVRLLDDSGRVVEGAFLELPDELWDPDT